jgi:hypothetical protein
MRLKNRLLVAGVGVGISLYGAAMLRAGRFSYQNHYAMTLYSPGVIALGAFFCMLAFLPPASFIQRLSTKVKPSKNHHTIRRTDRA